MGGVTGAVGEKGGQGEGDLACEGEREGEVLVADGGAARWPDSSTAVTPGTGDAT